MSNLIKMTKEDRVKFKLLGEQRFAQKVEAFIAEANVFYQNFFKRIPVRYQKTWLECWEGTANKRKAIAAKCYECVGYEDTQNNVGKCTSRACPLWRYRPLQK